MNCARTSGRTEAVVAPKKRFLSACCVFIFAAGSGCATHPVRSSLPHRNLEGIQRQIRLRGPATLYAGAARVEITPPVGTPLAGYSRRKGRPSQGVRDPLYVRALALSDGEDTVLLGSADLLVIPPTLMEKVVRRFSSELHLPRQAIILAATHTHSGAGAIAPGFLYQIAFGRYNPRIEAMIIDRLIQAARQALEHRQPVRWGLGVQEDFLGGLVENRMIPGGSVDAGLRVLLLESLEGRPQAIMVNAAAHPTLLSSKQMRFSADYPGALTQQIEAAYPGVVCLFVNGAAGDLRPRGSVLSPANNEERVYRFGRVLAEGTTGLVNQLRLESKGDLAAWGGRFPLPLPRIHLGPVPLHPLLGRLIRPSSAYLNLVALNRTVFVPLVMEMTTDLGNGLKEKLSAEGLQPVLMGYADGYLGYAVTPAQYKKIGYEVQMSWYGPHGGEMQVEELIQLAHLLQEARRVVR